MIKLLFLLIVQLLGISFISVLSRDKNGVFCLFWSNSLRWLYWCIHWVSIAVLWIFVLLDYEMVISCLYLLSFRVFCWHWHRGSLLLINFEIADHSLWKTIIRCIQVMVQLIIFFFFIALWRLILRVNCCLLYFSLSTRVLVWLLVQNFDILLNYAFSRLSLWVVTVGLGSRLLDSFILALRTIGLWTVSCLCGKAKLFCILVFAPCQALNLLPLSKLTGLESYRVLQIIFFLQWECNP